MKPAKPLQEGIKSKVIAAFLLSCVAIIAALVIVNYSFQGLLSTVDELTVPNKKLQTLNVLFQQITQLDQLQRASAIRNPGKKYASLFRESKPLMATLDSLRNMTWADPEQLERLNEMERLLIERDKLLLSYFRLKSEFVLNKKFTTKLDSLASIISWSQANRDTSVTTTERKTITTTYPVTSAEDDESWWERTFGGKKKNEKAEESRVEVQEELRVKVDTIYSAQQDSAIAEIGRMMKSIENDQRTQNEQMVQRELQLVNANTKVINQLLSNLREVEKEERTIVEANNEEAAVLVNESIRRISLILIVCFIGASLLVFRILIDISKSNKLRKQLIEAKDRAEELSQVKQRFLANMSHEIRTPLQSIIGFTEQLKQEHGSNRDSINAIHSSSEHLLHIVNEILDFSKIESGKLTFEKEAFDLRKLLHEVEAAIRVQADKKNLELSLELNGVKDIPLLGDPFRLRQILYNLLGNAVKFTLRGTVKLIVTMKDMGYHTECQFKITDTGLGMTQEEVSNVFQQFEQAHSAIDRQFGGTGLGLTIVKKLVETQKGKLSVESIPGVGSTFTVELGFDKAPALTTKQVTEPTPSSFEPFEGKVMVVDDDPLILKLCSIILEKYNIPNRTYTDPVRVLEEPLDKDLRLILLDIRLPGVNGADLCKELRKKTNPQTRIVALTAHVLPQERNELLQNGFDQVLTKPFKESELLEQLGITSTPIAKENGKSNSSRDLHILREMTMGDEELFQSILSQFLSETEEDVIALEKNMTHLDVKKIREHVHRLAGRIGQVGADKISQRLRTIEDEIVDGKNIHELAERIFSSINEVQQLVSEIREDVEVK